MSDDNRLIPTNHTPLNCSGHQIYMCSNGSTSLALMISSLRRNFFFYAFLRSDYPWAHQGSSQFVPSCIDFLFLVYCKALSSICFLITISAQKSLLRFLDKCWYVKTIFNACFRSCIALNITFLTLIGILAIHYRAYVTCQSITK